MRGLGIALVMLNAGAAAAETIAAARFSGPTDRYAHGVLGDAIEWSVLEIDTTDGTAGSLAANAIYRTTTYTFTLPLDHVFEDIAPRLADVTGDGAPEVIVVETDVAQGAALAIYTARGKLAETPHIGTRNRWLAPVGAADLDGDGHVELAYVDRPHLAKTLRIWRFKEGELTELASAQGASNHKIGWDFIPGGLRDCGNGPEMIVATANWSHVIAATFDGTDITTRNLHRYTGPDSLEAALTCP